MAKSIRSKRMRKLRAFKRIRYGEKELARLKNMLAKAAEEEKLSSTSSNVADNGTESGCTDVDQKQSSSAAISKPPKYPCWLSNFRIKKLAKQEKKQKKKETKRLKKEKKLASRKSKKKSKSS